MKFPSHCSTTSTTYQCTHFHIFSPFSLCTPVTGFLTIPQLFHFCLFSFLSIQCFLYFWKFNVLFVIDGRVMGEKDGAHKPASWPELISFRFFSSGREISYQISCSRACVFCLHCYRFWP